MSKKRKEKKESSSSSTPTLHVIFIMSFVTDFDSNIYIYQITMHMFSTHFKGHHTSFFFFKQRCPSALQHCIFSRLSAQVLWEYHCISQENGIIQFGSSMHLIHDIKGFQMNSNSFASNSLYHSHLVLIFCLQRETIQNWLSGKFTIRASVWQD